MKFWILLNVAALLTFAADKNSFVEDCGSTALRGLEPPHRVPCGGESQCEESASITPLDKIHEAVMITAEEVKRWEDAELKKRKSTKAKAIEGKLGTTSFFEADSGEFLVRKSLKGWNAMDEKNKYYQTKKLDHEKLMYEKLQGVDGILNVFLDQSSIENIVMESMSMDAFAVLFYLLYTKKNVSNGFLVSFLTLLKPLSTMHERGITHNDISIENIMYRNGVWKFIDFDRARENLKEYPTMGHPEYWSPAQQNYNKRQKCLNVFPKFETIESKIADLKKEDVYALGIAALILIAPRSVGLQLYQSDTEDYGAFKLLFHFLKQKNQLLNFGNIMLLKNKQYDDNEDFMWEDYHQYLVGSISDLYDPKLKTLIGSMIHPDSEKRVSAKDALQMLNEITKN